MIRLIGTVWTYPWTALGLLLAKTTDCLWKDGFWQASRGSRAWAWWSERFGMAAITLGETVIVAAPYPSERLLRHELHHAKQYRRLGLFFPVAYLLGMVWGWALGDWHRYNPFEVAARDAE